MTLEHHLNIMILEDNRADIYLLQEALRKAEVTFTALIFEDGESAFRYIDQEAERDTNPVLDVAILDLNVPRRNGSEVLNYIRRSSKLFHIPVVILSSSPTDVMRDRAAQADCYITKPSDLDAFLKIGEEIRDCVQSVREARNSSLSVSCIEGRQATAS